MTQERIALATVTTVGVLVCAVVASAFLHGVALVGLTSFSTSAAEKPDVVKVKIVERPPPAPQPTPPPPPPPEPTPPPKKKDPPKPAKVATEKPQEAPKEKVEPIQGLDAKSLDPNAKSGFAVPMGNTLMTEDTGKRVDTPPPAMAADLSQDPVLIRESIVAPEYTQEALDAGFEGLVDVDVYVDASGKVTSAEMRKKVGYGMDKRILESARVARFTPRRNKLGAAEPAWTAIRFNVRIP
jgi:TonB family protein